jgi:hypothetical protein
VIPGTLRDNSYFTGTWQDLSGDRYHWGAFQLWWHSKEERGMVGKFVGKGSDNHIDHGIWLWARDERKLCDLADWAVSKGYSLDTVSVRAELGSLLRAHQQSAP